MVHAGVAFYNTFLRSVSLKKIFFWSAMVLIAVHIAQVVLVTGKSSSHGYNQLSTSVAQRGFLNTGYASST